MVTRPFRTLAMVAVIGAVSSCSLLDPDGDVETRLDAALSLSGDSLSVSIHNEGDVAVEHRYGACTNFLERRLNGAWQGPAHYPGPCTMELRVMTIAPGEVRTFQISMRNLTGEFRVHLNLHDGEDLLPLGMRVSEPFALN